MNDPMESVGHFVEELLRDLKELTALYIVLTQCQIQRSFLKLFLWREGSL